MGGLVAHDFSDPIGRSERPRRAARLLAASSEYNRRHVTGADGHTSARIAGGRALDRLMSEHV
jgi:hypothetical protein